MSTPLPPRSLGSGEQWGRGMEASRDALDSRLELQEGRALRSRQRDKTVSAQIARLTTQVKLLAARVESLSQSVSELKTATKQNARDIADIRRETEIVP